MYQLIEFADEKAYVRLFLSLPRTVYKDDKNYVPESKSEVVTWLTGNHPCAKFLKQKNLVVLESGSIVARGIVFINEIGNFGSIGFFECQNDPEAVGLLADAAKGFCRALGIQKIYASMNGSIWGGYRIMTKGFLDKPYMGEPYNKPYYYDVLTKCGFYSIKKWETQFVRDIRTEKVAKRIQFISKLKGSNEITVRGMLDFDQDIRTVYKLIMNAFSGFFLFHEIDEQTYVALYNGMRKICDKRTMKLAFDKDNCPVGFGLAFPNYNSKLKYLFKHASDYILWFFGVLQTDGESANPFVINQMLSPVLQFMYSNNKGSISAMMSEDSKALSFTKEHDYTHEYVLLEMKID